MLPDLLPTEAPGQSLLDQLLAQLAAADLAA